MVNQGAQHTDAARIEPRVSLGNHDRSTHSAVELFSETLCLNPFISHGVIPVPHDDSMVHQELPMRTAHG